MKAYITLLSTDNYYPGVIVLNRSLKKNHAQYPLFCAISEGVNESIRRQLEQEGVTCLVLSGQTLNCEPSSQNKNNSNWSNSFDKLRLWGLTQFEKLVYLDSDLLIRSNIDFLFDAEPFSGVCAGKSYPGNEKWHGINSGVVIIKPDTDTEEALIKLLPSTLEEFGKRGCSVGDQDILQFYLSDSWDECKRLHLDDGLNMFADFLHHYIKNADYSWNNDDISKKRIYIVHFIGKYKPWMSPSISNLLWIIRMSIRNPYYLRAFREFRSYL